MLLDLSRFRTGTERVDRQFEPSTLAQPDDEFRILLPVTVSAELRKDGEKVRLVGRLSAMLELDCSRCLDAFPLPVESTFDTLFLPAAANTGDDEHEIKDDDLGVSYYKDEVIDLGEVIREQLYLALPMKPLCRDECLGLCSVCGKNRNRDACTCQASWVDPRLEALRKLRPNH